MKDEIDRGATAAAGVQERSVVLAGLGRAAHEHRAYLSSVARAEGLSAEDALDAVQEAFFVLIARPEAKTLLEAPAEELRSFLATVTRNWSRNQRRLHRLSKPHGTTEALDDLSAGDATADALVSLAEERIRLLGCLRTLEKVQRAVVSLRLLDEQPGEDVAKSLGLAKGHVAVLLHRAKQNLIACMAEPVA